MAKKAKKRGVKPGTKRGPYKRVKAKRVIKAQTSIPMEQWMAMNESLMKATEAPTEFPFNSVGSLPSLISELEASISELESQLTAQIDRIKSILV